MTPVDRGMFRGKVLLDEFRQMLTKRLFPDAVVIAVLFEFTARRFVIHCRQSFAGQALSNRGPRRTETTAAPSPRARGGRAATTSCPTSRCSMKHHPALSPITNPRSFHHTGRVVTGGTAGSVGYRPTPGETKNKV